MWLRIAQMGLGLATLLSVAVAQAGPLQAATPDHLMVPRQNALLARTLATGVQVYECAPKADAPGTFQWTFKEPVADLWDESGELVGRHYAGPTWESQDGSTVVGSVLARADAPERGAIPWLLLMARTTDGVGDFSRVTYVQRIETVGGVAPVDGCDQETAHERRAVEYRATYTFYGFDPRHTGDAE